MGILRWAIHKGTLMSRDLGDPEDCESEQKARERAKELEEYYKTMGYFIWYAYYYEVPGKDYVEVHPGNDYR